MKWYVSILFLCGIYNSSMLGVGGGSPRNLAGFVLCTAALLLLVSFRLREGSFPGQEKLVRRLGVFLLGGFICPRCGEAKVRLGGWQYLFVCPGCDRFFFEGERPATVKETWALVWRRKS